MRLPLLWKALAYRVIAIAFTAFFIGLKQSIEIHIGLTLLYYVFDLAWERLRPQRPITPPLPRSADANRG
jgi:predicted tellurium resistance membrane protein TerC